MKQLATLLTQTNTSQTRLQVRKDLIEFTKGLARFVCQNFAAYHAQYTNIFSRCRHEKVIEARAILYVTLHEGGYSYKEIAKIFDRHHTTIMHHANALRDSISQYARPDMERKLDKTYQEFLRLKEIKERQHLPRKKHV